MALRDLSQEDFAFWRNYNLQMINTHEKEFLKVIDPDLMRAIYRGSRVTDAQAANTQNKRERMVTLNRIFTTTNTILPNLYYQNPRKIAIPTKGSNPDSAAFLTAALNHYTKATRQKQENQEAIMNAWFFGLGWKKVGYTIATESESNTPESKISLADRAANQIKTALGVPPTLTEAGDHAEIVRYESLTNSSESPACVLIDHMGDLNSYKVITHRIQRTLFDLKNFGGYDKKILADLEKQKQTKSGTRFDDREINTVLNEMMIEQRGGIYILSFVDEFNQPLRYERIAHNGAIPWEPLTFSNEPGVRYPISHMKIASGVQEWIDNMVNLQIEMIGKMRSQHIVNGDAFDLGQRNAFKRNKIGGIVYSKRPMTRGDITEIRSTQVGQDQFNVLQQFQQNLTEIMGTTEQRVSGSSKNDTLGQDQLAEVGGQVRESGMQDRIREWIIQQARHEADYLQQFSNSELNLTITKQDYSDPETGQSLEDRQLEFFTPRQPLPLRMFIEGDFDFDVNISEAVKPNNPVIRKELMEFLNLIAPLQDQFINEGGKTNLLDLVERIAETFDSIDAKQFIERLDPRQQAALQASKVLRENGGLVPQDPIQQQEEQVIQQ